jgi:hypothetical protein
MAMQNNIKTSRLAAVRRLYVYWVAFVSQIAMLIGINELVGVIGRAWLEREAAMGDVFFRTAAAGSISVLVVATPIFLIHWGVRSTFVMSLLSAARYGESSFYMLRPQPP